MVQNEGIIERKKWNVRAEKECFGVGMGPVHRKGGTGCIFFAGDPRKGDLEGE